MNTIKSTLESLGFTEKEVEIYLKLLELGSASYTDLSKSTGIRRTSLYTMVEPLLEQGVVHVDLETKKLIPESPETLFAMLQQKVLQFHRFIPQLKSISEQNAVLSRIKFYDRPEQMKKMFLEEDTQHVPKKDRIRYTISDVQTWNGFWKKNNDEAFLNYLPNQRAQKMGYRAKLLFSGHKEAPFDREEIAEFKMHIKFLPKSYKHEFDMEIRPHQILIANIKGERPYGIKIVSTELAMAMRGMFEFMWDMYA
ncbi:MAG TPA: helix-turn-helix domain-containing protein [Candidatus Andersenbacteria bacterium]|nr:helix-turn-helix domain-containing protein [Candidatus Andersenbacteria bacterium]